MSSSWTWVECSSCGAKTISGKYCMRCGRPLAPQTKKESPPKYVYHFNIIVVGEDGVGKTTLINSMVGPGQVPQPSPQGFGVLKRVRSDAFEINLGLKELDGVMKLQQKADAALVVFEVPSRATFLKAVQYVKKIREEHPEILVYMIGNKSDQVNRQVSYTEASKSSEELKSKYLETVATLGHNVETLTRKLLKDLLTKRAEVLRGLLTK